MLPINFGVIVCEWRLEDKFIELEARILYYKVVDGLARLLLPNYMHGEVYLGYDLLYELVNFRLYELLIECVSSIRTLAEVTFA